MKECVKFEGCKVYSRNFMFSIELGANRKYQNKLITA
jgi:hypothetical protein